MFVLVYYRERKYLGGIFTTLDAAEKARLDILGEPEKIPYSDSLRGNGFVAWIRQVEVDIPMKWSLGPHMGE